MKRVRHRVKELTGRNRNGAKDVRVLIRDLNPVLRGWGNYFRTGNADQKFNRIDDVYRLVAELLESDVYQDMNEANEVFSRQAM